MQRTSAADGKNGTAHERCLGPGDPRDGASHFVRERRASHRHLIRKEIDVAACHAVEHRSKCRPGATTPTIHRPLGSFEMFERYWFDAATFGEAQCGLYTAKSHAQTQTAGTESVSIPRESSCAGAQRHVDN